MSWPKGVPRKGYVNGSLKTGQAQHRTIDVQPTIATSAVQVRPAPSMSVVPMLKATGSYEEIGRSGLKQVGGFLQEEFDQNLRGQKGAQKYREMVDNNASIGAFVHLVKRIVQQVKWRIEPHPDAKEDGKKQVEFFESALHDMEHTWPETLSEILSYMVYGYAPMEVTCKVRRGRTRDPLKSSKFSDGLVGWAKMGLIGQESVFKWNYDEDERNIVSLVQLAPPKYVSTEIPYAKILNFRADVEKDSPEGRSMLRSAYWDWYFYKRLVSVAAIGAERDLNGVPVMTIPAECMDENAPAALRKVYTRALQIVSNLRVDDQHGIVIPQMIDPDSKEPLFKLELLSTTKGASKSDIKALLDAHQTNMLRAVFADFMMLGAGKTGSWALSSDKTDMFGVALGGILDSICGLMNRKAIPDLARLNGWEEDMLPTLEHGDVETPDLAALGTYIKTLTDAAAITPDNELEDFLREAGHLPKRVEDAEDTGIRQRPAPRSWQQAQGQTPPEPEGDGPPVEPKPEPESKPKPEETPPKEGR